jgi:hypothetical protein
MRINHNADLKPKKIETSKNIIYSTTSRGFGLYEFKDRYNNACSIQKSSLATEDCIWLGLDNANPQILASKTKEGGTGWVSYPIPEDVSLNTRMHLTQDQVKELLPILKHFVETGHLVNE